MYSKKYLINTATGLQQVDGLKNSSYFVDLTNKYINNEISISELRKLIATYYSQKPNFNKDEYQADIVSANIADILSEDNFVFSPSQLIAIHKRIFNKVFKNCGTIRTFNFQKKELILNEQSVLYGDYRELEDMLTYDFNQEKKFDYRNKTIGQKIDHLADFISNIWQIHPFTEGNTRTVAVFLIKYLRTLKLDISSDIFKDNSIYFRNALVRANYKDPINELYENKKYLVMFLRNMILNEKNQLSNKLLNVGLDIINFNARDYSILKAMLDNPKIKIEDISKLTKLSVRTIKYSISRLKSKNILKRVEGKQKGHWIVNVDI